MKINSRQLERDRTSAQKNKVGEAARRMLPENERKKLALIAKQKK